MAECQAYLRELEEAADGAVTNTDARAHAALCRTCGDELRKRESLRALVGGLGKVEAPADFEFRLRARIAAAKGDGVRFGGARWLYGFAPVAVAACFVIVSATLYFRQAARTNTAGASAVAVLPSQKVEPDGDSHINKEHGVVAEPLVAGGRAKQANPTNVASSQRRKSVNQSNARGRQAREVAFRGQRHTDVAPRTLVSSFTGARVITGIPVKASAEPLRVILRDERGAGRVVPMRSVSFGSQDFLARGAAVKPSAAVEVGGVW
ncbi:MAG: hypothetical protein ACJ754_18290 [Pyrinomonadaceae bacterium]